MEQYTVVLAHMAAPIPGTMPYENAAVLPLALSTAACGLFQKDQLALQHPSATPKPTGKTLLIWGGSTSVGGNAIQLAVAAGYEVITTTSPRNFDYVKKLGASQVFDYNSTTVVEDVVEAFKGKTIADALAIGIGSAEACSDIVHACNGNKFVSMTSPSVSFDKLSRRRGLSLQLPLFVLRLVSSTVSSQVKFRMRRIRTKFIFGNSLMDNEVSRVIYEDFLPQALADGRYVAAPDPHVVGKGLEYVQAGFDAQREAYPPRKWSSLCELAWPDGPPLRLRVRSSRTNRNHLAGLGRDHVTGKQHNSRHRGLGLPWSARRAGTARGRAHGPLHGA